MNNLTIKQINIGGQAVPVVDSREVAEMVEVRHDDLLKKIRGYKAIIDEGFEDSEKLPSQNFFIEDTYTNSQNKIQPCFQLTRKGCDMVANKMNGKKGVLFTAEYVTRFEEMEEHIKGQALNTSELSPELQMFNQMFKAIANNELEQKRLNAKIKEVEEEAGELKEEIQGIREAVTLEPNQWRKDTATLINKIANKLGGFEHIKPIRDEAYSLLNNTYGVDINRRLLNKKKNMALEGCSKSKIDKVNYLDVIAEDKKLINGYINIVGRLAVKYGIK